MIPHMNYQQYRTARRLVHSCCNYDCGNCLLLDDGEECVCVQSITYSLICKWFRAAVLPLDAALYAALRKQRRIQSPVQRQDGNTEPFTDQRVCDTLRADTFLAIVQEQTVSAIVVATAMYQLPGRPILLVVHVRDHGSPSAMGSLM